MSLPLLHWSPNSLALLRWSPNSLDLHPWSPSSLVLLAAPLLREFAAYLVSGRPSAAASICGELLNSSHHHCAIRRAGPEKLGREVAGDYGSSEHEHIGIHRPYTGVSYPGKGTTSTQQPI